MKLLRKYLENKVAIIITVLFITDLAILLNIPFLRQIFGFFCFTIIPGLLILDILKSDRIELPKKFVLSYGLSISSLMFIGLFLNFLYPVFGASRPLSTISLVISFTAVILFLCFIAHKRNKTEFCSSKVFNIELGIKRDQFLSPLIFPIIFPILTIFGVYLMNTTENNIVLLTLPFLIVIYAAFIVYFNKRIPTVTYPVAILMIGLALALILPLRGEYMLMGGDGSIEYRYFWLTATNAYWNIELSRGGSIGCVNACLSVALLHPIFQSLLGLTSEFTYKLVTPLLLSVTPLALFILYRNFIQESYAFLAALFFASQFNFVNCISGARLLIGIFFFVLAVMVFFDKEMGKLNKRILFLIFMFSLILSYYSYCYIFAILMFSSWMIGLVASKFAKFKQNITATLVVLCIAVVFLWWSQITESHFTTTIRFIENTFVSLIRASLAESSDIMALKAIGIGLEGAPEILNFVIYYITLILIVIGSIDLIKRWKTSEFGVEYTLMVLSCLILWTLMIVAPYISEGFGLERTYFPTLIVLAPSMIIGVQVICRLSSFETWNCIKQRLKTSVKQLKCDYHSRNYHKFVILITLVVVILNLFVATGITYQMFGNHRSVILNSDGLQYDIWYIHLEEIDAAKWLTNNMEKNVPIYTDAYTPTRFSTLRGKEKITVYNRFFKDNIPRENGYIFLRYQNVVDGTVYTWYVRKEWSEYMPLTKYPHLFIGKSKIYSNGGSEVWR